MKAVNFQEQNAPNAHSVLEATIDPFDALERMDPMEPRTPFPGAEGIPFDAETLYERRANGKNSELSRIETKFKVTIIAIRGRKRTNGHLQTTCLCSDGSELICDISTEAARTLEPSTDPAWKVRHSRVRFADKVRNFGYLEQAIEFRNKLDPELKPEIVDIMTGMVIDEEGLDKWNLKAKSGDWLDQLVTKHHPDAACTPQTTNSAICGRKLSDPESIERGIGPECAQKVGNGKNAKAVSPELRKASQLWRDERLQKWIIKGVLTLGAPIPKVVIPQKGMRNGETSYWGYSKSPFLYYLDADDKSHCIYTSARKLRHRQVPPDLTELDSMAIGEARDLIELLAANGGKKPRTILL